MKTSVAGLAIFTLAAFQLRADTISGTVTDPAGAPVSGAVILMQPNLMRQQNIKTDQNGHYQVEWRPAAGRNGRLFAIVPERHLAGEKPLNGQSFTTADGPTTVDVKLETAVILSVKITDADSHPVPGATAQLAVMDGPAAQSILGATKTTDASGAIQFDVPPNESWAINASAKGYGLASQTTGPVSDVSKPFDVPAIVLKEANLRLAGQALNADGSPASGAQVRLLGPGQQPATTSTDPNGRFAFEGVADGRATVQATFNGAAMAVSAGGGDTNIVIRFSGNRPGVPARVGSATITGTISDDATGAPVADARILIMPISASGENRSDSSGHFSIGWNPPRGTIATRNMELAALSADKHLAGSAQIDPTTTNVDLRLKPSLQVSLKVQEPDGTAVPGARITVQMYAGNGTMPFGMPAFSDDAGKFQMDVLPNRQYRFSVSAGGHGTTTAAIEADQNGAGQPNIPPIILPLANKPFAGKVIDESGNPVPNVPVAIMQNPQAVTSQPTGLTTRTDSNGQFSFAGVCEGEVRVVPQQGSQTITTAFGGDTNVIVRMRTQQQNAPQTRNATMTVSGTVTDPSGAPAANVEVRTAPRTGPNPISRTDAQGNYSVSWMVIGIAGRATAPRPVMLIASDAEHNLSVLKDVGTNEPRVDLRLEPGVTLAGALKNADGKPPESATITLYLKSDRGMSLISEPYNTDDNGKFEIRGLPRNHDYIIFPSTPGYCVMSNDVSAAQTRVAKVDLPAFILKPANLSVAGWVVDSEGKPAVDASITVGYPDGMRRSGPPATGVRTDDKGHFEFTGVPEGMVRINANLPARDPSHPGERGNSRVSAGDMKVNIQLARGNVPTANFASSGPIATAPPVAPRASISQPAAPAPAGPVGWLTAHMTTILLLAIAMVMIVFGTVAVVICLFGKPKGGGN